MTANCNSGPSALEKEQFELGMRTFVCSSWGKMYLILLDILVII